MKRRGTTAVRPLQWALPSPPVHLEVLSALPAVDTGRPPLLFVHGMAHGAWCFAEHWLEAAAAAGYPAYAVSLRGHGGSGGARRLGRTTLRDYVRDVVQTAAGLPQPPVLIGHSMGGSIVQLVMEQYPAPAGVLLAPAPLHSGARSMTAIALDRPTHVLRAVAGRSLPMTAEALFCGLDPATAARYADRCGRESPWAQYDIAFLNRSLGPIRAPILVIGSPDDKYVTEADVRRTARAHGTVPVWFPGLGHDLMLDRGQDRVLDTVLEWIGRAAPPPG